MDARSGSRKGGVARRGAVVALTVFVLAGASTSALAQGPAPGTGGAQASAAAGLPAADAAPEAQANAMTLDEALDYARAHQPSLRAAQARIASVRADADVPRAQWQPRVGVTAQLWAATMNNTTATYVGVTAVELPRVGATPTVTKGTWRPYPSSLAAVGGAQEIFDFGRIAAQAAASDAVVDVETRNAELARLDLEYDVREAFYAVLAAHAVREAAESAFQRSKTHRDYAKAGVDRGIRSPIELTRAEADLVRFDLGRVRARGGVRAAQGVLAAAIASPSLVIDARGEAPPDAAMPAIATMIGQASARDPAVGAALARIRQQELRTEAIGAELRPDISLIGSISGRAGGAPPSSGDAANEGGWLPNVPNWDVGVVLSWQVFDGTVTARQSASRRREDEARADVAVVRQREVEAIQQAYVAVGISREVLPGLVRAVEAARANMAQAEARFQQGLGTSVELADAEGLLADSEVQLAVGRFDIARTRAALGRAVAEGSAR